MFLLVSSGHKRPHRPHSSYSHRFESLTEAHRSDPGACNRRGDPQEDCIDAQDIFIETGTSRVSVVSRREGDYLECFFFCCVDNGETPRKCVYHGKRLQQSRNA